MIIENGNTEWSTKLHNVVNNQSVSRTHAYWSERAVHYEPSWFKCVWLSRRFGNIAEPLDLEQKAKIVYEEGASNRIADTNDTETESEGSCCSEYSDDDQNMSVGPDPIQEKAPLYDCEDFHFNDGTNTNRYAESEQTDRRNHKCASAIQSREIICWDFTDLQNCKYNDDITRKKFITLVDEFDSSCSEEDENQLRQLPEDVNMQPIRETYDNKSDISEHSDTSMTSNLHLPVLSPPSNNNETDNRDSNNDFVMVPVPFTINNIFEELVGLDYFYVPTLMLGDNYNNNREYTGTYAITHNNNIVGLITIYVEKWKPFTMYQRERNRETRQCWIHQRSYGSDKLSLADVQADLHFEHMTIHRSDKEEFIRIASNGIEYDPNLIHSIKFYSFELYTMMQSDNKGKKVLDGHGSSSSSFPCHICYANKNDIKKFPTPQTMSYKSRTLTSKYSEATAATKVGTNKKIWNLNKSKGRKYVPIYEVPLHKWGPSSLHNFEGIYAITMDCFKDSLVCESGSNNEKYIELQQEQQNIIQAYDELIRIQELINHEQQIDGPETKAWLQSNKETFDRKRVEYETRNHQLENKLNRFQENNCMWKFYKILREYKINLHYCMAGSVQGIMCSRIDKARHALVELISEYSPTTHVLWRMLFTNLCYIHDMLKKENTNPFNMHDMLSLKHAFLDFYHQFLLSIKLWRQKGSLGVKIHYLLHDIEQMMHTMHSCAFIDDQRIENVNQHLKDYSVIYDKYHGKNKEEFKARRMNIRALTCG